MALGLESVFGNPLLRLAVKTLLAAAGLFWAGSSSKLAALFLAALLAVYLYFRQGHRPRFAASFFVLLFLALAAALRPPAGALWPAPIFFAVLFFLVLGIKDLVFVNRRRFYLIFINLLFLALFGFYLAAPIGEGFFLKTLAVGLASLFLFKEFLGFLTPAFPARHFLAAAVFSFVTVELLWAVRLLPIGFISSAALMILFFFLAGDFVIHHFKGTLNRFVFLRNLSVFLILTAAVFAASRWTF